MKKLGIIALLMILLVGLFPQRALAEKQADFSEKLDQYLQDVSETRGYKITKEDINKSLATYYLDIEEFDIVDDMADFLGEVIKADFSNLTDIYEAYSLDEEGLLLLLNTYGEEIEDYIYIDDLNSAIFFYQQEREVEQSPDFHEKLQEYILQVSEDRGFRVTKEFIEKALAEYATNFEDFETVEKLSNFLGEVIKADLSNLDYFKDTYGLDKEVLLQLVEEKGYDINELVYIYELEIIVWEQLNEEAPDINDIINNLLPSILEQINLTELDEINLTEEELLNLQEYFMNLEEHFSKPEILERFYAITERLAALEGTSPSELSKDQINELVSIFEEYFYLLKLNAVFHLEKNGKVTTLPIVDLIKLQDLNDTKLKVEIFSADAKLLADFYVSNDILESITGQFEGIISDEKDFDDGGSESEEENIVNKPNKPNIPTVKTETGGQLPKTASNHIAKIVIGLILTLVGIFLFLKKRNVNHENNEK